ncbi:MAG: LysE/ArgO family amino acid transporter [Stappiaceae bacterium]
MTDLTAGVAGLSLGFTLIVAIGAQNAFVLRQGLLKAHVFAVSSVCFLSDALLIVVGVMGLGSLIKQSGTMLLVATLGGAGFLLVYGAFSLKRAFGNESMGTSSEDGRNLKNAILVCLALTWGNPHVYLDTVVLLGSLSARYSESGQIAFAAGAVFASGIWFYGLGYGAQYLAPIFAKPVAWRVLDIAIWIVMWGIAIRLISESGVF